MNIEKKSSIRSANSPKSNKKVTIITDQINPAEIEIYFSPKLVLKINQIEQRIGLLIFLIMTEGQNSWNRISIKKRNVKGTDYVLSLTEAFYNVTLQLKEFNIDNKDLNKENLENLIGESISEYDYLFIFKDLKNKLFSILTIELKVEIVISFIKKLCKIYFINFQHCFSKLIKLENLTLLEFEHTNCKTLVNDKFIISSISDKIKITFQDEIFYIDNDIIKNTIEFSEKKLNEIVSFPKQSTIKFYIKIRTIIEKQYFNESRILKISLSFIIFKILLNQIVADKYTIKENSIIKNEEMNKFDIKNNNYTVIFSFI